MRSKRFACPALAAAFTGALLLSACAAFNTPKACRSVCEDHSAEPCQQCIAEDDARREEAWRKRAEERRQQPPPASVPPAGGGGGGY